MQIRARNFHVLVKRLPTPEATRGGIILPDESREVPQLAHVIAIGPNVEGIKNGDLVLVKKFAGHQFHRLIQDEDGMMWLRHDDLLAHIKE